MECLKIKILKLNVTETALNISIKVTGKYNPKVRNPIVAIIFTSGNKYRRLPIPVQFYQPEMNMNSFLLLAEYSYSIEDLYIDDKGSGLIEAKIEFCYGNELYTELFLEKIEELNIYGSKKYSVSVSEDNDKIEIRNIIVKASTFVEKVKITLQKITSFCWNIILLLLSVLLCPVFIAEALLTAINAVSIFYKKKYKGILGIVEQVRWREELILNKKIGLSTLKNAMTKLGFFLLKFFKLKENRITFISNRRDKISGNYEYIYKELAKNNVFDIKMVLDSKESFISCFKYGYYLATSKVILIDDYIRSIYEIKKRKDNYLIQVWHACGAFKAFGFSRLSKEGCWPQDSRSHRTYDYCIVSSKNVAKYYAEAFGMPINNVIATGVPRTDVFFDEAYKIKVKEKLYSEYPVLKDKKVILFAPTFRGSSKKEGNYPHCRFDAEKLIEEFGDEYVIIIKHHPHVNNKLKISEKYKNKIIDLSVNEELNDLLFITDLLITDYSSVVFEASLLDIPMLFYAFDLQEYIAARGFYYEYLNFVPGKIVYSMEEILEAIKRDDFEKAKVETFKKEFFDELDGRSGERVCKFIENLLHDVGVKSF